MLMAAEASGAAPPSPAPPPAVRTRCIPDTWDDVLASQKAFIAAATPVMAVALGVITAVLSALKCPGSRYARVEPQGRRRRR
jgi:hypothetical protein